MKAQHLSAWQVLSITRIIQVFRQEYLWKPNQPDVDHLLKVIGKPVIFPIYWEALTVCTGSWRIIHRVEKDCLLIKGYIKFPLWFLKRLLFYNLWISHAVFGCLGSLNELKFLNRSPVFQVNGRKYKIGYFLSDGVYSKWVIIVKTILFSQISKAKLFTKH